MATFNDNIRSESENKSIQKEGEQVKKAASNQLFLDQNFDSHNKFDNEFDDKFDNKFKEKFHKKCDDKYDDKSSTFYGIFEQKQGRVKADIIALYCIIYAKKKLIRILNREGIVPKQQ